MTCKAPPKPEIAKPEEGSPAYWYAHGWRDGVLADSYVIARDFGSVERRVKQALAEITSLHEDMRAVAAHLNKRYGLVRHHPDRWEPAPLYLRGASEFARLYAPNLAPAPSEPERPKRARRRKARPTPEATAAPEPGPTLTLGDPSPPAEPELTPEAEMRRAAGRAWRA